MENMLWLNADGTLVPEDNETRNLIAGKEARFSLASTTPNILIAVRKPCEAIIDEESRPGRVVLAGDVSGFPLVDLLVSLNQVRTSGVLKVVSPEAERTLTFVDGELKSASSNLANEKIGEVAVRMGLVTREGLDQILVAQRGVRIGNLMVEKGLLQRNQLFDCIRQQMTEIFLACLMVNEGVFTLNNVRMNMPRGLNINTQGLLMDSVRQLDEMKEFRKRIHSSRCRPKATKAVDSTLNKVDAQVLAMCNGEHSIADISLALRLSEFDATKAVHHLLEMDYVDKEMSQQPLEKTLPTTKEVIQAFSQVYVMIYEVLSTLPNTGSILAEAAQALPLRSEVYPFFRGIQIQSDGSLPIDRLMQNICEVGADNPGTSRILYAIFAEIMYSMLFEAGEYLESATDENLSAKIKVMLEPLEGVSR